MYRGIDRYGLGQSETGVDLTLRYDQGSECTMQRHIYADAGWLMAHISDADREGLATLADFGGDPDRLSRVSSILKSEGFDDWAWVLAYHLAGGSDCKVTSDQGKELVGAFNSLVRIYEGQTQTTAPPVSEVTIPTDPGGPSGPPGGPGPAPPSQLEKYAPYVLGGIGLIMLMAGDRRRARRR